MGAQSSSQRDEKNQEDASASASRRELSAEVKVLQDSKLLEKNGQISSLTSLNGHSEDNTLAEVGQPDGVSVAQKEEASDTTETAQVEETPQVNGEKMDKESPDVNEITSIEEKATDEKPDNANEVGFKKIFSIVGLKFTLKKDKSEEADPVKLLIVKDKEGEEVCETEEAAKDKEATEKVTTEVKEADREVSATKVDKAEATDAQLEGGAAKAANEEVKEEGAEREAETSSPTKDTGVSSFRKFFSGGLFSNLRKKNSIKKTKDEEEKEATVKETNAEEVAAEEKEEKDAPEQETKEVEAKEKETQDEKAVIDEKTKEENDMTEKEVKEEKSESEPKEDAPSTQQEATSETSPEEKVEASATTDSTTETKQEDQKVEEKVPAEVTSEPEHQSSPEKSKPHGSPLKKLFTGAGLKKLSTKRHKNKKESEPKPAESGEQTVEQLQSSNESDEAPKADSGPSSPEASGEHVIAVEVNQNESSQEHEGETTSDSEKKKDGVIASFRKLVSPKKYAKRSSDSEDEGTSDKLAKSATLSSSESAPVEEKVEEKETKVDKPSEEEPKTENAEKLTSSTEEPKKKMDTSVSWEALMCIGGPKKRTRKTSDSDDEETKAEEETAGEKAEEEKEEGKTEGAEVPPQSPENEEVISPAPEPARESPWSTLKRLVMPKNKPKSEEKPEEPADQVQPDTETQKEESSFSLKKLFHGRRKKVEKQTSADQGSGEEDSDTPAVVPLSEYEEKAEAGQEAPAEPASVQAKVSADDRSPSWIPAVVEDDKHDQLSDIPEEVENVATPKSVDTDIADDDTEDQVALPKGPSGTGCKLSMAEVKPITLAPAAATSTIPQGPETQTADEVVSKIEAQVSEVPAHTAVILEDAPLDVASAATETEMENAKSVTKAILEPHAQSEVVAICTGLEIQEIEEVSLEQPTEPTVECIGPVSDVTSVEMAVEQKAEELEAAAAVEDPEPKAQVPLVQTLEPVVEELGVGEDVDVQAATERYEAEVEKVGVVGTDNSEVVQPTLLKQNSPNTVIVDSITPVPEMVVCTQTVEISEVVVETKASNANMEQHATSGENTPAEEVIRAVAQGLSTTECDAKEDTKGTEAAVPADAPSEESVVITETVVLVALDNGKAMEETIQEQKTLETSGKTEVSDNAIETQSAEIAEAVIKDAVGKVLEDGPQSEKSTVTIPTPVKAMATTDIATEPVVSTQTPVLGFCEKPSPKSLQTLCVAVEVTETVQLEVTENVKEEETPEKSLKMAAEMEVSKETIIEEEVTEISGETEQPEEKENKEVKEADEDVKSQLEECTPEEKSEKVLEIHMPTQVVLQSAEVVEELPVEVETVAELDKDGSNTDATSEKPLRQNELSDLPEEAQESASGEAPSQEAETEKTPSEKCAEVMAQVIEVIEEAVKEIEPVSTEVTATS